MLRHSQGAELDGSSLSLRSVAGLSRLGLAAAMLRARLRGRPFPFRAITIWNYVQLLGGSIARLALSLVYFLALTRSLTIADFGFFASAVAVGMVLARLAAFGYSANLLQISVTRPRTIGHYVGIYGLWLMASLPFCFALSYAIYRVSFGSSANLGPYMTVIAAEVILWRALDTVSAVNTGLGRFGFATAGYNVGTAGRALAALVFLPMASHSLGVWAWLYLGANAGALVVVVALFMPRIRPRYRRGTLLLRWRNALAMGGSGLATSLQLEIDKVLVFTFGGAVTAGLYAICIRLVDLTAVPTRSFNVLMIQRVLKDPTHLSSRRNQVLTEATIVIASTATFAVLLFGLRLQPNLLGRDIGAAAGLFGLLWAIPALRNLVEYQGELLYAHGRMVMTLWVALILTIAKTSLMGLIFWRFGQDLRWVVPMNFVFLVSYALSAVITYRALRTRRATKSGRQT